MPRNPQRISETLDLIESIWRKHPDLRLGQLLKNVLMEGTDLYYMEDDELYKKLCEAYKI